LDHRSTDLCSGHVCYTVSSLYLWAKYPFSCCIWLIDVVGETNLNLTFEDEVLWNFYFAS
jgi:hypothetical protein